MKWRLAILIGLMLGCSDQPTQALVKVLVHERLAPRLSHVDVILLSAQGELLPELGTDTSRRSLRYPMTELSPTTNMFSFAVVPDASGWVHIAVRAYAQDDTTLPLLEELVDHQVSAHQKKSIPVPLQCEGNSRCVPRCAGPDPARHVTCDGGCVEGWTDCEPNEGALSCETNLSSDPAHCGSCERSCPFGVCKEGVCLGEPRGNLVQNGVVTWPMNGMHGIRFPISDDMRVLGLGIKLHINRDLATWKARFKLALYEADAQQNPTIRLAQTPELTTDQEEWKARGIVSEFGGVEKPVSEVSLKGGAFYWMFFISDQDLSIQSQVDRPGESLKSVEVKSYSKLDEFPQSLFSHRFETWGVQGKGNPVPALYLIGLPEKN